MECSTTIHRDESQIILNSSASWRNSVATNKAIWVLKMKLLITCCYIRSLYSLKPKLENHPIKPFNLKETTQSKLPRSLPCFNVYMLKQKRRSQRHLRKHNFLCTILSIRATVIAILYILDGVAIASCAILARCKAQLTNNLTNPLVFFIIINFLF